MLRARTGPPRSDGTRTPEPADVPEAPARGRVHRSAVNSRPQCVRRPCHALITSIDERFRQRAQPAGAACFTEPVAPPFVHAVVACRSCCSRRISPRRTTAIGARLRAGRLLGAPYCVISIKSDDMTDRRSRRGRDDRGCTRAAAPARSPLRGARICPRARSSSRSISTDLYHDIPAGDAAAHASLAAADAPVMLQEDAGARRPAIATRPASSPVGARLHRGRASRRRGSIARSSRTRAEKDPATAFAAFRRFAADARHAHDHRRRSIRRSAMRRTRLRRAIRAQWLAPGRTYGRGRRSSAHVPLRRRGMEGGANVVVEAITAGTFGSRMSGTVGMPRGLRRLFLRWRCGTARRARRAGGRGPAFLAAPA